MQNKNPNERATCYRHRQVVQRRQGLWLPRYDGGKDVFVHHSTIVADGFRSLAEGDRVEFSIQKGPRGRRSQRAQNLMHAVRDS